jgi:ADP-ribose pyrophosphatase YjhB (NUDIX family)
VWKYYYAATFLHVVAAPGRLVRFGFKALNNVNRILPRSMRLTVRRHFLIATYDFVLRQRGRGGQSR